eukprot:5543469-Pyramimonas_sp.AAC.1
MYNESVAEEVVSILAKAKVDLLAAPFSAEEPEGRTDIAQSARPLQHRAAEGGGKSGHHERAPHHSSHSCLYC